VQCPLVTNVVKVQVQRVECLVHLQSGFQSLRVSSS
jgi:hypothetical protein